MNVDLLDAEQTEFDARVAAWRRFRLPLLVGGGVLGVASPLIIALAISAGARWMSWFWILPVAAFVVGLAISVATTTAERVRWRHAVWEIARVDLEAERSVDS